MKTSLVVAFISDPYHALMWKKFYEKNFEKDIDELLININGVLPEVIDFIGSIFPRATFISKYYNTINQGTAFNILYPEANGDILITMDSDNFIFKDNVISKFIKLIEGGEFDVIGSSGLHCTGEENVKQFKEKFGFVRYNPFMFLCKKELLNFDVNFEPVFFDKGYEIEGIFNAKSDGTLDVMAYFSILLNQKQPKKLVIGADNPPEWLHVSGLSGMVRHHLIRRDGKTFYGGNNKFGSIYQPLEMMSWVWYIFQKTKDDCPNKEFNNEYERAVLNKIKSSGHDMGVIEKRCKQFQEWSKI